MEILDFRCSLSAMSPERVLLPIIAYFLLGLGLVYMVGRKKSNVSFAILESQIEFCLFYLFIPRRLLFHR